MIDPKTLSLVSEKAMKIRKAFREIVKLLENLEDDLNLTHDPDFYNALDIIQDTKETCTEGWDLMDEVVSDLHVNSTDDSE